MVGNPKVMQPASGRQTFQLAIMCVARFFLALHFSRNCSKLSIPAHRFGGNISRWRKTISVQNKYSLCVVRLAGPLQAKDSFPMGVATEGRPLLHAAQR